MTFVFSGEADDMGPLVGAAIREARQRAGLSARALAARSGVSQPFLSQVERGLNAPSIATLYRIAEALRVSPADLLPARPHAEIRVVREAERDRYRVTERPTTTVARLAAGTGHVSEVYEYRIGPEEDIEGWFRREEDLALLLLAGRLRVEFVGADPVELAAGDCLFHPGSVRHRWERLDAEPVHLVLCVAGPVRAADG